MRNSKIYIPNLSEEPGEPNVRIKLVDIAYEGHPSESMMKRFMRSRMWFPGIREVVQGCLACQASTETKYRDPNNSSSPPEELCRNSRQDHWGPTPDSFHLLVVNDKLSRYPEVVVCQGNKC